MTAIDGLRVSGSLRCLFPRHEGAGVEAVLVNTAGGITGGDTFDIDARAAPGTTLTLTTQAAERAYRAQPGETGRLTTDLHVGAGARLNWVPQETILFDGAALTRRLRVSLAADAGLLLAEPLIFGRTEMGETVNDADFSDRIEIHRDGRPLFFDRTRLAGDIAAQLTRPHVANGARAMVLMIYVAPDAEARLDHLRALLPPTAGASLVAEDVLVARCLAVDGYGLRKTLLPTLEYLCDTDLPRCWRI